jgi:hypothetical protein
MLLDKDVAVTNGNEMTRLYLDASGLALAAAAPDKAASASYAAIGKGLTFTSAPFARELEFAGPIVAKLYVSSSTDDMDLFATLRAFDTQGNEITFLSAVEPKAPVSQGWLRVSQRKLDPITPPNGSPGTRTTKRKG